MKKKMLRWEAGTENSHVEIGMLEWKLVVEWSVPKSTGVVFLSYLFLGGRGSPSEYIT